MALAWVPRTVLIVTQFLRPIVKFLKARSLAVSKARVTCIPMMGNIEFSRFLFLFFDAHNGIYVSCGASVRLVADKIHVIKPEKILKNSE